MCIMACIKKCFARNEQGNLEEVLTVEKVIPQVEAIQEFILKYNYEVDSYILDSCLFWSKECKKLNLGKENEKLLDMALKIIKDFPMDKKLHYTFQIINVMYNTRNKIFLRRRIHNFIMLNYNNNTRQRDFILQKFHEYVI